MTRQRDGGPGLAVRRLSPGDWPDVARIYRQGIDSGDATFQTEVPSWEAWDAGHLREARLVAEEGGRVVGFAALSPVSARAVYRGVAEVTVYVDAGARGRGVGRSLMAALVAASEDAGIWTLQAGIFPENHASVAVHQAVGFRIVGLRQRLGRFHDGRWRDVVLMERRSSRVGLT